MGGFFRHGGQWLALWQCLLSRFISRDTNIKLSRVLGAQFDTRCRTQKPAALVCALALFVQLLLTPWSSEDDDTDLQTAAPPDATAEVLGLGEGESVVNILSFGYPAKPRDPDSRPAEQWIQRAKRKPREEAVKRV